MVLSQELTVAEMFMKFAAIYGTRNFIVVFTRVGPCP